MIYLTKRTSNQWVDKTCGVDHNEILIVSLKIR